MGFHSLEAIRPPSGLMDIRASRISDGRLTKWFEELRKHFSDLEVIVDDEDSSHFNPLEETPGWAACIGFNVSFSSGNPRLAALLGLNPESPAASSATLEPPAPSPSPP